MIGVVVVLVQEFISVVLLVQGVLPSLGFPPGFWACCALFEDFSAV